MTDPTASDASARSFRDAERIAAELKGLGGNTDPFVAAVRASRMPMIVTDPRQADNPVVFVNDAFCRLTQYTRDEILGRNCRFLQGPDTDPDTVIAIRAAVEALRSIEIDIRNHRKDGTTFWNRLLLAPVYDLDGKLAYFFASQFDVTMERERLQGLQSHNAALTAELTAKLQDQRERDMELRFTLEAGRFGAWTLDLETEALATSAVLRETFGRPPEAAFSYADLWSAIHPDDRDRVKREIDDSLATGHQCNVSYRILTPENEIRWVQGRARPIFTADGRPLRLSGVALDITEEKRAGALRQALVDLGSLFRNSQHPAELSYAAGHLLGRTLGIDRAGFGLLHDDQLTIERDWTAPGIESLVGTMPLPRLSDLDAALHRGETAVLPDAAAEPQAAATMRAHNIGALVAVPLIEGGRLVALLYVHAVAPRPWTADEVQFIEEVAERTRAAIERRRAEQELAALAASLEQQVAQRTRELLAAEEALRQSQKMEAIGQLTGGVAHDFNNLLTVIRSSVDLMRRPNLAEDRRRRYMDAISDTVNRAAKLTGQLLAFARRQALKPQTFDLRERLTGMADMIDTVTGARIRVLTDLPQTPCFVRADVSQFETALVNMAVNARDAMDGEGALTLRLAQVEDIPAIRGHAGTAGRFAAVSITDTGEGISNENLGRIFEPFFTTKGVGKGTGLGLSQVFGFAKQSGGDVDVRSREREGTTFTLFLPQIDGLDQEAPELGLPAKHALGGGGRRVLLVEDNVEVGRFSTQVLQDLGYQTVWATTAVDALVKLGDGSGFDVVFSDVVMPGLSGIELAKQIRDRLPGMPVVLTSGYSHVLAEEGAHGFELLHKPYSAEQVSRVLRRAITPSRSSPAS
ncbi:PAS domain-containing protein [Lichenihabitans sp. Uapishka_5]|uniref:PAS domain-containing protein n=1 Tax=Lichenihabitans sp. Uapishka_5 TaxID=3037302 RepID=UPI0029E7E64B|nr:PAS domain-containing protein [Lichenihabitans sp. Uapishka_5]MDX7953126.1 PAS domain-containing protein [Lichenihabitans sp. Uapishka_5]